MVILIQKFQRVSNLVKLIQAVYLQYLYILESVMMLIELVKMYLKVILFHFYGSIEKFILDYDTKSNQRSNHNFSEMATQVTHPIPGLWSRGRPTRSWPRNSLNTSEFTHGNFSLAQFHAGLNIGFPKPKSLGSLGSGTHATHNPVPGATPLGPLSSLSPRKRYHTTRVFTAYTRVPPLRPHRLAPRLCSTARSPRV